MQDRTPVAELPQSPGGGVVYFGSGARAATPTPLPVPPHLVSSTRQLTTWEMKICTPTGDSRNGQRLLTPLRNKHDSQTHTVYTLFVCGPARIGGYPRSDKPSRQGQGSTFVKHCTLNTNTHRPGQPTPRTKKLDLVVSNLLGGSSEERTQYSPPSRSSSLTDRSINQPRALQTSLGPISGTRSARVRGNASRSS